MGTVVPNLRPLGVIDQLDLALRLYRRQFVTFVAIVAVVQIPLLIIQTAYNAVVLAPIQQAQLDYLYSPISDPTRMRDFWGYFLSLCGAELGLFAMVLLIVLPMTSLMNGALAYGVSEAYLGRTATVGGALRYMTQRWRWGKAVAANFLVGLVLIVLAIIPCIGWVAFVYVYLHWVLVTQAVVLEDRGPIEGMRRSWNLAQGHLLRLVGLVVLGWGLMIVVSAAVSALVGLVFPVSYLPGETSYVSMALQSGLSGIVGVLYLPAFLGMLTVFYYDLRVRKEGYDLRLLADQMAATAGHQGA